MNASEKLINNVGIGTHCLVCLYQDIDPPTIRFIVAPDAKSVPNELSRVKSATPALDKATAVFAVSSAVNRWMYERSEEG